MRRRREIKRKGERKRETEREGGEKVMEGRKEERENHNDRGKV